MLLAVETATELVGVALSDGDTVVAEAWVAGRRRHAETLAPLVGEVLRRAGVTPGDLGAVAVDVGPGLFTGLRVGVATAKGLAYGAGIGVVPVTSLEALAWAAGDAGHRGDVVAVVDARRAEVFAATFTAGPDGTPAGRSAPARHAPEDLCAVLAARDGAPLLAVGDGAVRYRDLLAAVPGVTVAGPSLAAPPPAAVARVAAAALASGAAPTDPMAVAALYLRDADARINWVVRRGPADPAEATA